MEKKQIQSDLLVVGAGIAGVSTTLEVAETGYSVTLIEKNPFIGGRVARINKYFPKLCPPSCGMEINIKRLQKNENISMMTLTEVVKIDGDKGDYTVTLRKTPRYVKQECMKLQEYSNEINVERPNEFNLGIDNQKVLYQPYNNAFPDKWVFDKDACSSEELKFIANTYSDAINLDEEIETIELKCKAICFATGWKPYDASQIHNINYDKFPNVITNVQMERYSSPNGPTQGKIINPAGGEVKKVAFAQCAGSRDETHLEYCSSICCLASMKQAEYIREQYPESEIHIFYIDLRTHGIFEEFYWKVQEDENIFFHRGKIAKIKEGSSEKTIIVEAEDTIAGEINQLEVDMVVLATGMQPTNNEIEALDKSLLDRNGFFREDIDTGIFGCGVATGPKDVAAAVQDATGAAIKALHTINGVK